MFLERAHPAFLTNYSSSCFFLVFLFCRYVMEFQTAQMLKMKMFKCVQGELRIQTRVDDGNFQTFLERKVLTKNINTMPSFELV